MLPNLKRLLLGISLIVLASTVLLLSDLKRRTLSLQAVANANRGGKMVQVFGAVADPAVAGVGISYDKPLDHPRNLVGIGSLLPVGEAFGIARDMFPGLKRVG